MVPPGHSPACLPEKQSANILLAELPLVLQGCFARLLCGPLLQSSLRAPPAPHGMRLRQSASSGLRKRIAVNAFHAVLVEREGKTAEGDRTAAARSTLEELVEALQEGYSLIVFPEGTRGNGLVGPFKSGIYHLWCRRPDVQFVPVHLSNLNRILPKGEFLPVPVISRVIFGAALKLDKSETKESFLRKAHEAVCALEEA